MSILISLIATAVVIRMFIYTIDNAPPFMK